VTADNELYGISMTASSLDTYFTGLFKKGGNGSPTCWNGNTDLTGATGITSDCQPAAGKRSDHTLVTGITTTGSFVGKVDSDSTNPQGSTGSAAFETITDWVSLDTTYRGWGKDGDAFPAPSNRPTMRSRRRLPHLGLEAGRTRHRAVGRQCQHPDRK